MGGVIDSGSASTSAPSGDMPKGWPGGFSGKELNPNDRTHDPMKNLFALSFAAALAAGSLFTAAPRAAAHCQVPCGIYDDHARVAAMLEDAATVEKAVAQLADLAGKTDPQSLNQVTRWVVNKESHAQKVIATISDYFLTQRVKPDADDYAERLAKHHAVILAAMKAKQSASAENAAALKAAIEGIADYYPAAKAK